MQGRHEHRVQQPKQDSSAQDQVLPSHLLSHPLSVLGLAYGMLMLFSISEPTWTKDLSQLHFLVCHVESTTVRSALLIPMKVLVVLEPAAMRTSLRVRSPVLGALWTMVESNFAD